MFLGASLTGRNVFRILSTGSRMHATEVNNCFIEQNIIVCMCTQFFED